MYTLLVAEIDLQSALTCFLPAREASDPDRYRVRPTRAANRQNGNASFRRPIKISILDLLKPAEKKYRVMDDVLDMPFLLNTGCIHTEIILAIET